jgi:hypothetical protein
MGIHRFSLRLAVRCPLLARIASLVNQSRPAAVGDTGQSKRLSTALLALPRTLPPPARDWTNSNRNAVFIGLYP